MGERAPKELQEIARIRDRAARRREAELDRFRAQLSLEVREKGLHAVLERIAVRQAREAYTDNFPSRRGTYQITDNVGLGTGTLLVVYSNNPWAGSFVAGVGCPIRDREFAGLRERAEALGLEEVARGTYPAAGESAGYTEARLFCIPDGVDPDLMEEALQDAYEEAIRESLQATRATEDR